MPTSTAAHFLPAYLPWDALGVSRLARYQFAFGIWQIVHSVTMAVSLTEAGYGNETTARVALAIWARTYVQSYNHVHMPLQRICCTTRDGAAKCSSSLSPERIPKEVSTAGQNEANPTTVFVSACIATQSNGNCSLFTIVQ